MNLSPESGVFPEKVVSFLRSGTCFTGMVEVWGRCGAPEMGSYTSWGSLRCVHLALVTPTVACGVLIPFSKGRFVLIRELVNDVSMCLFLITLPSKPFPEYKGVIGRRLNLLM